MMAYSNTGNFNTGDYNSGDRNSGRWNSGNGNSGYGNSGNGNSGYRNSGYGNSGYWNSGYGNSGYRNSGNGNSGYRNSGYGNSCSRSSGIFCTQTPKLYLFNKPTDFTWEEIDHPHFQEFYLNKWIKDSDMTDQEKIDNPKFHVSGGYLKTFEWEEAWANYWRDCDEEEKQRVLNLPNFDAEIFKEITGINVEAKPDCDGKIVKIEGVEYRLERV